MKQALLLTGEPGVGKTTIIKEALASTGMTAGGFYTEEIRTRGVREGFRIVTLDGEKAILAHVSYASPFRVSKYGVDVDALDRVGVRALRRALENRDVIVVDEIGKMELFSEAFRQAVLETLERGKKLLGTIMLKPHPWADGIKARPEVELVVVTRTNREQVRDEVVNWLLSPQMLPAET